MNDYVFPQPLYIPDADRTIPAEGITKREYFAVTILQGMVCSEQPNNPRTIKEAVRFADELLEELERSAEFKMKG